MRVFIQKGNDGDWFNANCFAAFEGFTHLGYDIWPFKHIELIDLDHDDIVFGLISSVNKALRQLNLPLPQMLDYPLALDSYLNRYVYISTLGTLTQYSILPVFIKPYKIQKLFSGCVISSINDMAHLVDIDPQTEIWVSPCVDFISEYRCFVLNGKLVDAKHYDGDFKIFPDFEVIESAIRDFINAPCAYALDFGVTSENKTILVEASDCYALGSYGLDPVLYARMIEARWKEFKQIKKQELV